MDYNSIYSGITEETFTDPTSPSVVSFEEAQRLILNILEESKDQIILVGHSIENDLIALRVC